MQHSPEGAIAKIIQSCHCRNYNNYNMYDNIETFYGAIAKIIKTANTTTVTATKVSTSYIMEASVNFNIEWNETRSETKVREYTDDVRLKAKRTILLSCFSKKLISFWPLLNTKIYICVFFFLDLFYIPFEIYYL